MEALDEHDLSSGPASARSDDEAALWRAFKAQGSAEARERLFGLYLEFANRLAKRHYLDRRSGDIELADLCQLASAGLLEAIDHFDPDRGVPFRGYARRRISGSMLDGITHMSEMREQLSFRRRVRSERVKSLTPDETEASSPADALEALIEIATGLAVGFMLEGTSGFSGEEPIDPAESAYCSLAWKETVRGLMAEVEKLPEREQLVIRQHYLMGLGFDQISRVLGVSPGRVSQLHRAGIGRLRQGLARAEPFYVTK